MMREKIEIKSILWLAKSGGSGGGKSFSKDGKDGKEDALAPLIMGGQFRIW